MTEPKTLADLRDGVVAAACRWHAADIYVHPVLDRAQAVKVGVADLIDAVQNWKNAQPAVSFLDRVADTSSAAMPRKP